MRILLAEDDHDTADFVADALHREGHDVHVVATGTAALERPTAGGLDAAILDRMLPGMDGMAVLGAARAAGVATHVLMLTALGSISNRVEGLQAGADDYLVKPFALTELIARVHALQRRVEQRTEPPVLVCGPFHMNIMRRELRYNGKAIPLQPRELRLLEELMRNAGETLTRAMLLQTVWGLHFEPQTNLVDTHMSRLRTKLALAGAKDVIHTVRGTGYRFDVAP